VARTVGGLEELDDEIKAEHARSGKGAATLVPLDLADMAGIDRLGGAIHERWGKLDILVANAGVLGTISPIGHVEAKVFEKVMTINVTATWRLIRSVDPLLRLSDAGRAILVTSGAAHTAFAFWGPYAASKAAVEALTRSWADETKSLALRVNVVDPRATRTAMRAQAMPGENPERLPHPSVIAANMLALTDPALTRTGELFDAREKVWKSYLGVG
jgi:NAD(P)-dependent dehydrogenase (short-subunit alcohol dehydrogenase family)